MIMSVKFSTLYCPENRTVYCRRPTLATPAETSLARAIVALMSAIDKPSEAARIGSKVMRNSRGRELFKLTCPIPGIRAKRGFTTSSINF